jgi:hypothetical protein
MVAVEYHFHFISEVVMGPWALGCWSFSGPGVVSSWSLGGLRRVRIINISRPVVRKTGGVGFVIKNPEV